MDFIQLVLETESHTLLWDPVRLLYAATALLLVSLGGLVTGAFHGNAGPLIWTFYDMLFGTLGDRLDRTRRKKADLVFRGFLLVAAGIFTALVLARMAAALVALSPYGSATEIVLLLFFLSSGSLWRALLSLYKALENKKPVPGAYYIIAQSSRTDLNSTDDYGITRTAVGLCARSFTFAMVAPVLWYVLGGLTGAFVYSALAALAWRFGKNGFTKGFGAAPLLLEKIMGYVPAILAALLLSVSSIVTPTAKTYKALSVWKSRKGRAPYAQGGAPLSVMAWALNVSLGGPVKDLKGSTMKNAWVGPKGATAQIDRHHLRRALLMSLSAHLFLILLLSAFYLLLEG